MEDILEVYVLSYDPNVSLICMDGQSYQLFGQKYEPTLCGRVKLFVKTINIV